MHAPLRPHFPHHVCGDAHRDAVHEPLAHACSFAVAKPNQADQVMAAVTDLPHGQCFGVRSASQLALDVPWLSFGDERSCEEETAVSLRTLHEACAKLTTKVRSAACCMHAVRAALIDLFTYDARVVDREVHPR